MLRLGIAVALASSSAAAQDLSESQWAKVFESVPVLNKGETLDRMPSPTEREKISSAIKDRLKDPESARFKWTSLRVPRDGLGTYCFLTNAKNSFGGYTGFEAHSITTVAREGEIVAAIMIGSQDRQDYTVRLCAREGYDDLHTAEELSE
ncbi:hypothetical protein [Euryhalocaulis caribicus]|uniref:hypothetical protein n=1 Tax=Euryhalocaulis caribicus TaxID=1161401 RepID=UPI0003A5FF13|nr:hypothetical protein [Euryhalocaulis caribicus]